MTPADRAAATIARERMIGAGNRVLVAFSGGADSTALALVLSELGYEVVLGHVDHGMRPESGRDAEHCAELADRLRLPFLSSRVRVVPPTQAEARRARYRALESMASEAAAARIATGHTLDDQAETVQLRLDRGGYGLGIPPVRGRIVRPLLEVRRRETEAVCRRAGINFLMDPSNRDLKYSRVAVRQQLAGAPDAEVLRLTGVAEATRAEAARTAREVAARWELLVRSTPRALTVRRSDLRAAPRPVVEQLIRRVVGELGVEVTGRSVADIVDKVLPVTGARLALPGGLSAWAERDQVVFGRYPEHRTRPELTLNVPGTTRSAAWGLAFTASVEPAPDRPPGRAGDRFTELVDAGLTGSELTVRQWRPGDRFHPLGSPGTRKLQDFFVDSGVPRHARAAVPVVVSGDRIVWVAGHRIDHRFRIGPGTTEVLRLALAPAVREQVA